MSGVAFCGQWILSVWDSKLVAVHTKESREPFEFDCSTAEKQKVTRDSSSGDGPSEETGSDRVLAFAASPSGELVALSDDSKRLVLLGREPSWHLISVRWLVRRCTCLVFSRAEDQLLAADKSGDVYSFSVLEAQRGGQLRMGHLSMLLSVTMSPDDKYIITADRDEKIRVSHHSRPHNIQAFCLGHRQFVSVLHVPSGHPQWLLSGSGDGTLALWDYESGCRLESVELLEGENGKNRAVSRVSSCPGVSCVAVLCDGVPKVFFFTLRPDEPKLVPHSVLQTSVVPLDLSFDSEARLWLLLDSPDSPLQLLILQQNSWTSQPENPEVSRVMDVLRRFHSSAAPSRFEHLYKAGFDNVSIYLQKKQQRMEQQKRSKPQKTRDGKRPRAKSEAQGGV